MVIVQGPWKTSRLGTHHDDDDDGFGGLDQGRISYPLVVNLRASASCPPRLSAVLGSDLAFCKASVVRVRLARVEPDSRRTRASAIGRPREFAWTLRPTSMRPTSDSGSPKSPVDRIGATHGRLLAGAPRPAADVQLDRWRAAEPSIRARSLKSSRRSERRNCSDLVC